jgi:hypothetical protein
MDLGGLLSTSGGADRIHTVVVKTAIGEALAHWHHVERALRNHLASVARSASGTSRLPFPCHLLHRS